MSPNRIPKYSFGMYSCSLAMTMQLFNGHRIVPQKYLALRITANQSQSEQPGQVNCLLELESVAPLGHTREYRLQSFVGTHRRQFHRGKTSEDQIMSDIVPIDTCHYFGLDGCRSECQK